MLFVLFSAGADRYAIASEEIEEIVPFAALKSLPGSHPALSGLLNFHGTPVPVIDLNFILANTPSPILHSTRILLIKGSFQGDHERILGLVGPNMNETRKLSPDQFRDPGTTPTHQKHIGRVFEQPDGRYLQWIHPQHLFPTDLAAELFTLEEETP